MLFGNDAKKLSLPQALLKRVNVSGMIIALFFLAMLAIGVTKLEGIQRFASHVVSFSAVSLLTFLLLRQWERNLRTHEKKRGYHLAAKGTAPAAEQELPREEFEEILAELRSRQKDLIEELNEKNESLHRLETEKTQFQHRIDDLKHEFDTYKSEMDEELRRKLVLLSEYQETINQQREVIKKKQEEAKELENKVKDLNYEVKTLLQLADVSNKSSSSKPKESALQNAQQAYQVDMFEEESRDAFSSGPLVKNADEAFQQLKRCVDIAQKITGANRFGNTQSRFKDIPINNRALDLRRLFDNLRSENSAAVVVYSQRENKVLFVNNQTSELLGWNPEKFMQHFPEIIAEGRDEWKKGISALAVSSESKVRMVMKAKSGQNLLMHCHLGIIPTGAFRNHIIGLFYPA